MREKERGFVFTEPPTPSCHASSVARVGPSGVVAWFGGTHEKHPDVGIWLSRREGAGPWEPPRCVAKISPEAHWNPVLFAAPDGALHLWFKVGATIPDWKTFTQVSLDAGRTWSEARELVPGDTQGGRGPVKNKPILLAEGAWLAGASSEQRTWEAFADRSDDGGRSWTRSASFERTALGERHGCIQPALWESEPGRVHALVRSSCGFIARTDSGDGGRTWSPLYDAGLPGNNSGLDIARRPDDGALGLVFNPVAQDWGPRTPLRLALSFDNGLTWPEFFDIETAPDGEFSYPAVLWEGDAWLVSYTHRRERIAFFRGT